MKLTLRNVRKHSSLEVDLSGGLALLGDNGVGKTSVLDAISFLFYNRTSQGKTSVSEMVKVGESEMVVMLDTGENIIKRVYDGVSSSVYKDDIKITQEKLSTEIAPIDLGLWMINPFMWLSTNEIDTRKKLFSLIEAPDSEGVFKELYGDELYNEYSLLNGTTARKRLNDFKISLSTFTNLVLMNKDILKQNLRTLKELNESTQNSTIKKEVESYNNLQELQNKLASLEKQEKELIELQTADFNDKDSLANVLSELDIMIADTGRSSAEEYLAELEEGAKKGERFLAVTKEQLSSNIAFVENMEDIEKTNVCDKCGTELSPDVAKEKVSSLLLEQDKFRDTVIRAEAKLKEIYTLSDKLRSLVSGKKTLQERINVRAFDGELLQSVTEQIANYRKEISQADSPERQAKLLELEEYDRAIARIKEIEQGNIALESKTAESEINIGRVKAEIKKYELLVKAFGRNGVEAKQAEAQSKVLNDIFQEFTDVEIISSKKNKSNDNIKQVFEVTREGVSSNCFSLGELLEHSIILSLVLRRLAKDKYPVFDFVCIDEAVILGAKAKARVNELCNREGVHVIYTQRDSRDKLMVKRVANFS
jgi:DNA repair exonuclease SbcCD ATPase subunit